MKTLPVLCTVLFAFSLTAHGIPDVVANNVTVDNSNKNTGTPDHWLRFGGGSGEGIGSNRDAGFGQYGLSFYTGFQQRMTLENNGALSLTPGTGGNLTGLGLNITQSSSSGGAPPPYWAFNNIQIAADSTHYPQSGYFGSALTIGHNFGGAGTTGNRNSLQIQLNMTGPTSNPPGVSYHNYVAGFFGTYGSSDNGVDLTNSGSQGSIFALNALAQLKNNALNISQLAGMEIDIEALPGSTVRSKNGLIINYGGSDSVSAAMADNMIALVSSPLIDAGGTVPGAKVGIEFGYANDTGQGAPVRYSGTLIKTTGPSTVANGIDFSSYNIRDSVLKGKYSSLTENSLNLGDNGGFAVIGASDAAARDVTILLRPKGNGTVTTQGVAVAVGGFRPPHLADSEAAKDTIYFSTNSNKLVYKDPAGISRPLN